jgi:REP element-mobilizing transposase RayT
MPNTYSQIYLQFIFAVKHRLSLIPKVHKEELHRYITGLVQNRNSKMLAINCMPDHTHLFIGYKPSTYIPDFIKEIKVESNEFINSKNWVRGKFSWQDGYGVFSYSQSEIGRVIKYIKNQETHHAKTSFRQEYTKFLEKFQVEFDVKYLFEFYN